MGEGYGPMIVAKSGVTVEQAKNSTIAVPISKPVLILAYVWHGRCTVEVLFDEIIPRILDDTYLSGLIIHEGQLTYVDYNLDVLIDIGKWWNNKTDNFPMPRAVTS